MNTLKIIDDYEGFTNNTQIIDDESDDIGIILKLLFLSNPCGVFFSLISYITLKPLLTII